MTFEQWLDEAERRREATVDIGALPPSQPWDSGTSFPRSASRMSSRSLPRIEAPPMEPPSGISPVWIAAGLGIAFVSLIVGGILAWVIARH